MNNLYVFAIGGSGERVVKSLVMMLSTGMNIGAQRVIPVFIDNDEQSCAYQKCKDLIKYYNANPNTDRGKMGANTLYKRFNPDPSSWGSFFHVQIDDPIILNRTGEAIGDLKRVIGYVRGESEVHKAVEEEMNLLFTNDDLTMPLNVGFVGNPNIGSIVLNTLSLQDQAFKKIMNGITPDDGVIAVGSLFGGTGAAGMPLIINTFKNLELAKKPVIGGVAVLPYFTTDGKSKDNLALDASKWDVKSDAFLTKTRAALMYYDEHMKLGYDYMYYVGDSKSTDVYEHCRGGAKQDNPYHIIEVMSALSVIDFSYNGHQDDIVYKSPVFGFIASDDTNTTLRANLSGITNSDFAKSIVKFQIMKEMFERANQDDYMLKWAIDNRANYVANIGFDETCRKSVIGTSQAWSQAWGLCELMKEFDVWMKDLSNDKIRRPFVLYNNNEAVNADNITTKFFTENKFGIALSKMEGIFNRHEAPVKANIADEMLKAYKRLYSGKKLDDIKTDDTLPMLLNTISEALDEVMKKNCIVL